jgi:ATP adenylyltransferase
LHSIYKRLHSKASSAIDNYAHSHPEDEELKGKESAPSPFSYNLAMTTDAMLICPRRREGKLLKREDESEVGFVQFNGTLLAGTLMVKGETEWDWLRNKEGALDEVLEAVGIPWGSPDVPGSVSTKI